MSIWQTKMWWEMLVKSQQAEIIYELNWIFIEKRKVSMWEYWLFVLWLEKDLSEKDVYDMIILCKNEKALFFQVETLNYNKFYPFSKGWMKEPPLGWGILKEWYYKKFITPYTAIIDTTLTEEEILSNMKPKGRYNIKLAEKKWVVVKDVDKTDENIQLFYNLMLETTSRDWFSWNKIEYYKIFLKSLDSSKLLLAFYQWVLIAWWIFVFEQESSIYYYWASSWDTKYRNLMSPYLLQWEAIKISKNVSSKLYDFLWVAGPNEENSPLSWVTDFKKKFTEDIRFVSNSYIYVNKKFKYTLINIIRKLRKK